MQAQEDKRYNGWANYETWAVNLWLSNEEPSYRDMIDMAREVREECEDAKEEIFAREARFVLADRIKDYVEESMPDLEASLASDLLSAALSEVDWLEISDASLESLSEED